MVNDYFKEVPLETLVSIHDSERIPVKKSDRKPGNYPYYGASGITDYIDEYIFDGDYVLLSEDGDNLRTRNTPIAFMARGKFWVNNHAHILKGKDGNNTDFICYALQVAQVDSYISGSTRPKITQRDMKNIPVSYAPIPIQNKIVHILGTLDEKIELNRQMNETLEAMAQALFKSWFVDFDPVIDNALLAGKAIPEPLKERAELRQAQLDGDKAKINSEINNLFPSEFEFTDEFGWIPKGWEVKNLSEIAENIFSGGTPNTKKAEYWNGDLNWFSSGETRENIVVETEKTITEIGVSESSTKLARYGDVLIASAGQGHTRGQTSFCSIDTYFNQSVVCVRPQEPTHYSWLFFNLYGRYEEMRALSDSHSIRGSLTTKLLSSMSIIKPDENILAEYENIVGKHILKIKENKLINNNLAKLRDTLLPKLMSGELRIPDAEKLVADI